MLCADLSDTNHFHLEGLVSQGYLDPFCKERLVMELPLPTWYTGNMLKYFWPEFKCPCCLNHGSAWGLPHRISPPSGRSPQHAGCGCLVSFVVFFHSQCLAQEGACSWHVLQLDFASFTSSLKSSSFTHLLHLACTVTIFRTWNDINTQSMCPSSHLLIRSQYKSLSLNWAGQMFKAHLYTSRTRHPTGYCLISSTTKWGERQHFFQQLWLGHLSSPTLCLSLPLCLFESPKAMEGKHLFGVTSNVSVSQN